MKKLLLSIFLASSLQAANYCVGSSFPGITCANTYALSAVQTAFDAAVSANGGVVYIETGATATGGIINKPRTRTNPGLITITSTECGLVTGRATPSSTHLATISGGMTTQFDLTGATAPSWITYDCIQFTSPPDFYNFLDLDQVIGQGFVAQPNYWGNHIWLKHIVADCALSVRLRNALIIAGDFIYVRDSWLNCAHSSDGPNGGAGGVTAGGTNPDESHEISGANLGRGIYIENNLLTCEAICSIFGGAVPVQRGVGAKDIHIRGNRYIYPWKYLNRNVTSDPSAACNVDDDGKGELRANTSNGKKFQCGGTPGYLTGTWAEITNGQYTAAVFSEGWQKNKVELKSGEEGVIEGNVIEGGSDTELRDNQNGSAFLNNQVDAVCDTVIQSDGCLDNKWATVRGITTQYNLIRHVPQILTQGIANYVPGSTIDPTNYGYVSRMAGNTWKNNLGYNIGAAYITASRGRILQFARTGDKGFGSAFKFLNNTFLAASDASGPSVAMDLTDNGRGVFNGNIISYLPPDGWYYNGALWTAIPGAWPAANGREFFRNVMPSASCSSGFSPSTCIGINMLRDPDGGEVAGVGNLHYSYSHSSWYDLAAVALDSTTDPTQMTVGASSPFKNWGPFGGDPGACISCVTAATANAVSGTGIPNYLNMHVKTVTPGTGTINVKYLCPGGEAGTLKFKKTRDFSSGTTDQADSSTSKLMRSTSATLTAGAWFGQLSCGTDVKDITDANGVERFIVQ